jgi:hypothetical protein
MIKLNENFTLELIKPIFNFPNYFIDIYGNIYSNYSGELKIRKIKLDKDGYRIIVLKKNKLDYYKRISSLVLETFVSPRPQDMIACHGVNGKIDDSLSNLSWKTYSQNNGEDRLRDKTLPRGEQNGKAKLTEQQVLEIRKLKNIKTSIQLSIMFNVSRCSIYQIWSRKTWIHL